MFLLIVADGTLFALFNSGEIMRVEKDSLGRELLAENAVYGIYAYSQLLTFIPHKKLTTALSTMCKIKYGN